MGEQHRLTIRIPPELYEQLQREVERQRSSDPEATLNQIITGMLSMCLGMLVNGREELRSTFTGNELDLIMDACNGYQISIDPTMGGPGPFAASRWLDLELEDAIRLNHLDSKWGVDAKAFLAKFHALSTHARFALLELIVRFWSEPYVRTSAHALDVLTA